MVENIGPVSERKAHVRLLSERQFQTENSVVRGNTLHQVELQIFVFDFFPIIIHSNYIPFKFTSLCKNLFNLLEYFSRSFSMPRVSFPMLNGPGLLKNSNKLNNLPLFSTIVPAIIYMFLSCRPFVATEIFPSVQKHDIF